MKSSPNVEEIVGISNRINKYNNTYIYTKLLNRLDKNYNRLSKLYTTFNSIESYKELLYRLCYTDEVSHVLIGGYVIVYAVTTSWLIGGSIFNEEAILNVDDSMSFRDMLVELTAYAKGLGCSSILVGNVGNNSPAYVRLLERNGFHVISTNLMKEL